MVQLHTYSRLLALSQVTLMHYQTCYADCSSNLVVDIDSAVLKNQTTPVCDDFMALAAPPGGKAELGDVGIHPGPTEGYAFNLQCASKICMHNTLFHSYNQEQYGLVEYFAVIFGCLINTPLWGYLIWYGPSFTLKKKKLITEG